jgi:hypothetical protein
MSRYERSGLAEQPQGYVVAAPPFGYLSQPAWDPWLDSVEALGD